VLSIEREHKAGRSGMGYVLVVNSSVPATTVKELVALIRANPGKYSFASTGVGQPSTLAGESLRLSLGLNIVQVP
jgi:tripartite-type tricarboxylate transporter receptor subunit TctC